MQYAMITAIHYFKHLHVLHIRLCILSFYNSVLYNLNAKTHLVHAMSYWEKHFWTERVLYINYASKYFIVTYLLSSIHI